MSGRTATTSFRGRWGLAGVAAAGALALALVESPFYLDMLFWILLWAAMAGAWNVVGGYAGQFSLGHGAFFGIGAYTSTLLYLTFGLTPWAGALAGGCVAAVCGVVVGVVCLRLRGPFFALATFALAELLRVVALYWRDLTGGAEGLILPFEPSWRTLMFRSKVPYGVVALGFLLLVSGLALLLEHSRVGLLLEAIREDEDAARSVGVRALRWKLGAAALSAFLAALGGTIYAHYLHVIEPDNVFGWEHSVQFALISIIGGMASWQGPILGSLVLTPLAIVLRGWFGGGYPGLHLAVYGPILILSVLFVPEGIVPWLARRLALARTRRRERLSFVEKSS